MKRYKILAGVVLLAFLSGCAASMQVWYPGGGSTTQTTQGKTKGKEQSKEQGEEKKTPKEQ